MQGGPPCPRVEGRARIAAELSGYLSDESRMTAEGVDVIFFPESLQDVCEAVRECAEAGMTLTVAGARTGIVGGAVPAESQAVISLERLNHIKALRYEDKTREFSAQVEAGVILQDFQEALHNTHARDLPWADDESRTLGTAVLQAEGRRLFYPVDPTETSAQIGGTVATNASGARTFRYGPTRVWVKALTVVLASEEVLRLRRGEALASDGRLVISSEHGGRTVLQIPLLDMPATKHTAGYYLRQDMDAIDLFVGSEGTLGIVAEVELRLELEPRERLFMTVFPPSEANALGFVQEVRHADGLEVLAVEYFGPNALRLLREKRVEEGASSGVPPLPESAVCAAYVEVAFDGDEQFEHCYRSLEGLLERFGASPRGTWAGFGPVDMRAMRTFRHALPEQVNSIIGRRKKELPSLHKVGTDMAVPDERLEDVMALYRTELEASKLEHVIFGHVGDNHLHVNILPRSEQEMLKAKALYELFAREVVAMGGSVSGEHGIGRIKRSLLLLQYGPEKVKEMKAIKDALDPDGLLNPGVLF